MAELLDRLRGIHADVDGCLRNFNQMEALYLQFVKQFSDDNNLALFLENYQIKDYDQAIFHIHTLKGVSGQLGFTRLFQESNEILQRMRAADYEYVENNLESLQDAYEEVKTVLEEQ